MEITITLPVQFKPIKVKQIIEGNLWENSKYKCHVQLNGFEDDENVYTISSDQVEAFYLIGMTVSELMRKIP